jgi:hypothetical protein
MTPFDATDSAKLLEAARWRIAERKEKQVEE